MKIFNENIMIVQARAPCFLKEICLKYASIMKMEERDNFMMSYFKNWEHLENEMKMKIL